MADKYVVFVGMDLEGYECLYIRKDKKYIGRKQIEGIAQDLESRLNNRDVWRLFVQDIAAGDMTRESMIAEAKNMLREGDEI